MNPYLVLGVPRHSDDPGIRRAYLDAIKAATPESDPARFQAVVAAYDRIKDETSRHRYELFNRECPGDSPVDAVLRHLRVAPRPAPLPFEAMKEFLRSCAKT
jgi:curved DNA-binding protein CbpA